jgi:Lar family restriction alleviation protein
MLTEQELKPCPFCGTKELHMKTQYGDDPNDNGHFVWCGYCDTYGPWSATKARAMEEWNTRPIEAELEAHLSPQVVVTTKEAWEKIDSIRDGDEG